MLEKIAQIKNIGRFWNYAASGGVSLRKLTLIHAENGRGKTTLCAIRELMPRPEKPRRGIGFEVKEGRTVYRKGRKNGQPRQ